MTEAPPFVKVLDILFGVLTAGAVSALAKLGVPDHLESGPKTPAELASLTGSQEALLYRLMRTTASVGILSEGPDGKFSQTPMSAALRTNGSPSLRHVAMFLFDEWHVRGVGTLEDTVRTGERMVERIYGMPMFDFFPKHPELASTFHKGMTNMSTIEAPPVVDAYDFSGIGKLTDVAGGHGLLLATILARYPSMQGTLYEVPSVIDTAAGGPTESVKDRVTFVKGDMFQSVPPGADCYIMKHIIHDWPDDVCIKILKSCRAGVTPGGKLLVVEPVVPLGNEPHVSKVMDIEMMLFPGGMERTAQQYSDLFSASGWKLTRIVPTASHNSIVEGVPT